MRQCDLRMRCVPMLQCDRCCRPAGPLQCGTVDDYQGQEERCIFISTTLRWARCHVLMWRATPFPPPRNPKTAPPHLSGPPDCVVRHAGFLRPALAAADRF